MAIEVKGLDRKFIFKSKDEDILLDDPNPKADSETVKRFYCDTYPELSSANIKGPDVKGDGIYYTFTPKVGTKG